MTHGSRPLVAGNWKMNGLRKSLAEAAAICEAVAAGGAGTAEVVICPPATLLMAAARICEGSPVALGGQHCHGAPCGPFTGDISAEMLKDAGATYVILGHSERRFGHHEGNASVRDKAGAAFHAGLTAIICVGETQAEREAGDALRVVGVPIGGFNSRSCHRWNASSSPTSRSGRSARVSRPNHKISPECTASSVTGWTELLPGQGAGMRILYGGSVKPGNAAELLRVEDVDGALVGGASLSSAEFMAIAGVYR